MVEPEKLAMALFAAGQSRRFGDADKLAAELNGKMLGLHAAEALAKINAAHRWVIASSVDHPCTSGWSSLGFEIAVNERAQKGLSTSVALAARLAKEAHADALLIALADMPFVTPKFFATLASKVMPDVLLASHNRDAPTPPALVGSVHFSTLMQASGDRGAGDLLKQAEILPCPPDELKDIDTPGDLQARK